MNQDRSTQTPKTVTKPAEPPGEAAPKSVDRLGFYRVLASFPALASFRAKINAVVLIGALLPAFLLVLAIVLGAGRISAIALIVLVVLFTAAGLAGTLWALGRLLVPLDLATESIDDVALERPLIRVDPRKRRRGANPARRADAGRPHRIAAERRKAQPRS